MLIIEHRKNTISDLIETPINHGVEIDIRSNGNELILAHDPFCNGELFSNWLKSYKHAFLILNVKEEGLEEKILYLMHKHAINNFFFLDQSFPFLIKTTSKGERRSAVRFSEYESVETVFNVSSKLDWVWLDSFNEFILNSNDIKFFQKMNCNLCIVSPELQGRTATNEISKIKNIMKKANLTIHAVCTKRPGIWIDT